MWRMLWMTLGVIAVAVGACEQQVLVANPSSDYEVVALVAE